MLPLSRAGKVTFMAIAGLLLIAAGSVRLTGQSALADSAVYYHDDVFEIDLQGIAEIDGDAVSITGSGEAFYALVQAGEDESDVFQYNCFGIGYLDCTEDAQGEVTITYGDLSIQASSFAGYSFADLNGDELLVAGEAYGDDDGAAISVEFFATLDEEGNITYLTGYVTKEYYGGSSYEYDYLRYCLVSGLYYTLYYGYGYSECSSEDLYDNAADVDNTSYSYSSSGLIGASDAGSITGASHPYTVETESGTLAIEHSGTASLKKAASGYAKGSHNVEVTITAGYQYSPLTGLSIYEESFSGTLTIDGGSPIALDVQTLSISEDGKSISYTASYSGYSGSVSGKLKFAGELDFGSSDPQETQNKKSTLKAKVGSASFDTTKTSGGSVTFCEGC